MGARHQSERVSVTIDLKGGVVLRFPPNFPCHLRLRAVRVALGVSQTEAAESIGVARPTIAQWEGGFMLTTSSVYEKIAVRMAMYLHQQLVARQQYSLGSEPATTLRTGRRDGNR